MNFQVSKKLIDWSTQTLTLLCILFSVYHIFQSAHLSAVTFDEPNHFSWTEQIVEKGDYSRNLGSHRSTMPVTLINYFSEYLADQICRPDTQDCSLTISQWTARRMGTVLVYLFLIAGTIRLGTVLSGIHAGLFSACLVALDASIIAHSALVTVDIAFAASVAWLFYSLIRMYRSPSLISCMMIGCSLGLCSLTKYTVMLFLPAICFVLAIPFVYYTFLLLKGLLSSSSNSINQLRSLLFSALYPLVAASCATLVISLGFNFDSMLIWPGDHHVNSETLRKYLPVLSFIPIPLPLPAPFISGLDLCLLEESKHTWNVVLNNSWYSSGTWKYFITLFFYKTPTPVILLTLSGTFLLVKNGFGRRYIFLLSQIALAFIYFSFIFSTQVGYRYILFLIPLVSVIIASILLEKIQKKYLPLLISILLLNSYFEYRPFEGYMLSYVNTHLVPREKAYLYVADSNFDWAHTYFDFLRKKPDNAHINPKSLQAGLNIFPAMHLSGVLFNFSQHHWLRNNLEPSAVYAHTYFAFDLNEKNFNKFLTEDRTFKPPQVAWGHCEKTNTGSISVRDFDPEGLKINAAVQEQHLCLEVKESSEILAITGESTQDTSWAYAGITNQFGICDYLEISPGETIFFRLTEGTHLFCYKSPNAIVITRYRI